MSQQKLNPNGKLLALEIAEDLPAMWESHPDGLTAKTIVRLTGMAQHEAYSAMIWLEELGRGKIIRRPDRSPFYLVPLDFEVEKYDLTAKQRATLEFLKSKADADGYVTASMREICAGAPLSKGAIVAHLEALDRKDYLRVIERGYGTRRGRYRIFPNGGVTGHSASVRMKSGRPCA